MPWIAGAVAGSALLGASAAKDASGKQSDATGKAVSETQREYNQSRADLAPYREAGTAALSRLRSLLGLGTAGAGGVDESDPRFKAIYQPLVDQFDQAHQARFGVGIYDPRADSMSRDATLERFKQQARDQFTSQYGGNTSQSPEDSSLLRKFTSADLNADPVYQSGLQFGLDEGTKAIERRAQAGGGYDSGATLKALTRFGNDYGSTKGGESYGRFRDWQDATYGKLAGVSGMGSGATTVGVGANTAAGTNLANLYTGQGNASAAASIAGSNAITGAINNGMGYSYLSKLSPGGQRTMSGAPVDPSMYAS